MGFIHGRTKWLPCPFKITRHTAGTNLDTQHQFVQLWKMRSWEWRLCLERDGENLSHYIFVLNKLQQKHLAIPLHLKLTFHCWRKEGPQTCFLTFTARFLLFNFSRSIYPHPTWNFLFEITAQSLQTCDETSEDQENALLFHWHRKQQSAQCSRI